MKKINLFILPALIGLFTLGACGGSSSSSSTNEFQPKNNLERVMAKLIDNNFSVDYYCSYYDRGNVEQNQKFYYTENAWQSDGYEGFFGVAYDQENVFKYTLEDGEVVSGQPLIDRNSGMRYQDVYDYQYGMQNFDMSAFTYEDLGNNTYKYEVGNHYQNDRTFLAIFLRYNILSSVMPESIIMKVVKDTITFDCVLMSYYDGDEYIGENNCRALVHSVGTTELPEIETYLENGFTSKLALDARIFRLFNPYMNSNNYSVYLDASGMNMNFKAYEYFTEYAYYENNLSSGSQGGYILANGFVHAFKIENEKVDIIGTPYADSDFNFYTSLYGEMFTYTFASLYFSNFIGYIDEENENSYYITDSQFVYTLAYLCYIELSEELFANKARIEIINDETGEFKVYFELYNKITKQDLGTFEARFFDLNNTKIPAAERYLNKGGLPAEQTKDELQEVLDLFKGGNYSMDSMTSAGLAKIYFTENYFYEELYQNPNNNFGFIKLDGKVYEFYMVDGAISVNKNTIYQMDLPGCGSVFGGSDDLSYFSHFDDSVCNANNYEMDYVAGINYWKNTTQGFSSKMYKYVFNNAAGAYPMGSGITYSLGDDPYDTRVSVHTMYVLQSGNHYDSYTYTYYDIGNTSHPTIEKYLDIFGG